IGYSLDDISDKGVKSIAKFESGEMAPTFNQLDTLADLYGVPRWVFLRDELPERYALNTMPAFRTFHEQGERLSPKTNKIVLKTLSVRRFMIELLQEMGRAIPSFRPPDISEQDQQANRQVVLQWLGVNDVQAWLDKIHKNNTVESLRAYLEDRGVLVFFTSRYRGKFYAKDEPFRGMAIYNDTLPIIIVNSSDALKAQAFTLMHELGHLLHGTTQLTKPNDIEEENWCNDFASEFLMPEQEFLAKARDIFLHDKTYDNLSVLAKTFGISVPACLMRLKKLKVIAQSLYSKLWATHKKITAGGKSGEPFKITRSTPKERVDEYGKLYLRILFDSCQQDILSPTRMMDILNLKKYDYLAKIEKKL
ncbi:MAG: ImmA/IrrE family metallo-endopeptidase, partial [Alphaproteobacteria bacterium GM202ARS2]|nr:ImmA/IrrE family metallo-endopeptidase [Alphaproteobacteria bacterium GM202ARS2]